MGPEDFGFRCVIGTGFADIFYGTCFKNGILPIILSESRIALLMADAGDRETAEMPVDLDTQSITRASGDVISFEIDAERRHRLLHGLDDIGPSLLHADGIGKMEADRAVCTPWADPAQDVGRFLATGI